MKNVIMDALMFLLFASQVLHISGTVTVLRGRQYNVSTGYERKLICISEDDGGALVWNNNLNEQSASYNHSATPFDYLSGRVPDCTINCKMNANENCLEMWTQQDWKLTNSLKTSMGPVHDQRWEEFEEYSSRDVKYEHVYSANTTAATLSVSIRASSDAHIFLCNSNNNYLSDFCYWIIIGGQNNSVSIIRKCETGISPIGNFSLNNSICSKTQVSFNHMPLSELEWRSFIIMWNSVTRNISVYDTHNVIMTYQDTESSELLSTEKYYQMFIRSSPTILFRFHIYNFLHTVNKNAILTSPIAQFDDRICIQMFIGLCAECEVDIMLRNSTNYNILHTVNVKSSSGTTNHGLPMWQSVLIKRNFSTRFNKVVIEVIPKLNAASFNPLWAIANVRQCPRNGLLSSLRWSVMHYYQRFEEVHSYFSPATCQKLFYADSAIVNSILDAKPNMELDFANCSKENVGPQCLIPCKDLNNDSNCKETRICYKDGCTCPPGFQGSTCSNPCKENTYGYGCQKICGSCRNEILFSKQICDTVTGVCHEECENFYLPPLCQIYELTIKVTFINSTSIQAIIPFTWRKSLEGKKISYRCMNMGHGISYNPLKLVFPNTTQLINFENLTPGVLYSIRCKLEINERHKIEVHVLRKDFETKCNPVESFDIKPGETNITINWQIDQLPRFPCPANWYNLIIQNIDSDNQIWNKSATSFPFVLPQLTPYTSFNITVHHNNTELFSQQIRTLESVPSEVLSLKVLFVDTMLLSNTFHLFWKPPDKPNGQIVKYEIIVKIKQYYGCRDLNLTTSENHIITRSTNNTNINITNVHPYAFYSVQVIAHNSRYSSTPTEKNVSTSIHEIPTEVFIRPKVQGWILSWSPPEDCTTILGPIKARIKIRGISNAVEDYRQTIQTSLKYLNLYNITPILHGVERYAARIYVIRDFTSTENVNVYQKYEFETPPRAPPSVMNLDVVEIDTRQKVEMIHLRWQSPRPPLNGKLDHYSIQLCYAIQDCHIIQKIEVNEFCDLWDNYICHINRNPPRNFKIQVLAYNMNVSESSPLVNVTDEMLNNTTPDTPNSTFTIDSNSVIDLKWNHPWRTGGHLQFFLVRVYEVSSKLRSQKLDRRSPHDVYNVTYKFPVTHYKRNYSERLYLFPSTLYRISIQAETTANVTSKDDYMEIETPSTIAFGGDLKIAVDDYNSMIILNIPPILNDTQDSRMHIIVKGSHPCKQYSEVPKSLHAEANIKMYDIAWQAAEIPTSDFANKLFMVGDNQSYGGVKNCPLKRQEQYEIVVIVIAHNSSNKSIMLAKSIHIGEVPSKHHEAWIIPILFLVLLVMGFYLYRRKKQKFVKLLMQDEMNYSGLLENIENQHESAISNSKKELSTSSDRQSLPRSTTSEVSSLVVKKKFDEEMKKEITSFTKDKDFEDYDRQAVQSGLPNK